jgi:hypothetical protein
VPIVLKSGSLSLLEPLGPVKVCNGIALAFYVYSFLLEAEWTSGPYENKLQTYTKTSVTELYKNNI